MICKLGSREARGRKLGRAFILLLFVRIGGLYQTKVLGGLNSPDGEKSREQRNETRESDWTHSEEPQSRSYSNRWRGEKKKRDKTQEAHQK